MKKESSTYNLVIHEAIKTLGISVNEYCIIDSIDCLSSNDSGWCYASKETLGKNIGITKQATIDLIDRMIEKKLLWKNPTNKAQLRPAILWIQCVHPLRNKINGKENIPDLVKNLDSSSVETMPEISKVNLPNNYSSHKEKNSLFPFTETQKAELLRKGIKFNKVENPDIKVIKIMEYFSDLCEKYMHRPELSDSEYFVVKKALLRFNFDIQKIQDRLYDWINSNQSPEYKIRLTSALHYSNIDAWLTTRY